MSSRRRSRKSDDPPLQNNKRKKLIQTKLDIQFSFRSSTSAGPEELAVMNDKEKEKPSTSEKEKQREDIAAAALIRATKISKNGETADSFESVTIDLSESPPEQEDCPAVGDKNGANASTSSKPLFWESDQESESRSSVQSSEFSEKSASKSPDDMKPIFLGVTLESLRKTLIPLRKLTATRNRHTILFDTSRLENVGNGQPPRPYPRQYYDKWDGDHVRMPCSIKSEYPVSETELVSRWELVEKALAKPFESLDDLKSAILSYNDRYASKWSFSGLERYIDEMEEEERDALFSTTLPNMAELALKLPELVTQPIPLLKRGMRHTVTMTQQQAACLLANAFFCTYPRRNQRRAGSEYGSYPEINFNRLFGSGKVLRAKLDFIFHYFRRVTTKMPSGVLSYERASLHQFPDWSSSEAPLTKLHVSRKGTIEDFGEGMIQIDFANKFLGGGVLQHGSVQEEIRFMICPELIVPMLFAEALDDNECFIMTGCERFSYYTGYGGSLQWLKSFEDTTPRDEWGRRRVEVIAIDAYPYSNSLRQFRKSEIDRELNKAYCGFVRPGISVEYLSAVATGNWGCGAFGGDKDLKSLIQIMAAAEAGRDVAYFTFDDADLMIRIYEMYEYLVQMKANVGSIYDYLLQYCDYVASAPKKLLPLFDFIRQQDQTT